MELDYADIGKRVRAERNNAGLSQERVAELAGISVTHMSNIENANTKVSLSTLISIANAIGCDISLFVSGNEKDNLSASLLRIKNILSDCTNEERMVIVDTLQALKNSLKENY